MAEDEPSINIPSLLTLAVVSFFVIRWFLSRDSGNGANGSSRSRGRVDPAQVEQIAQMFPQLNRRDVMWDLQRNGGSVAATTERILTGRGLETVSGVLRPFIQSFTLLPSIRGATTLVNGRTMQLCPFANCCLN
jgi:coupling of ubiquitin conjugation to ER degradation protein 1